MEVMRNKNKSQACLFLLVLAAQGPNAVIYWIPFRATYWGATEKNAPC